MKNVATNTFEALLSILLELYPEVGSLDYMVILCSGPCVLPCSVLPPDITSLLTSFGPGFCPKFVSPATLIAGTLPRLTYNYQPVHLIVQASTPAYLSLRSLTEGPGSPWQRLQVSHGCLLDQPENLVSKANERMTQQFHSWIRTHGKENSRLPRNVYVSAIAASFITAKGENYANVY